MIIPLPKNHGLCSVYEKPAVYVVRNPEGDMFVSAHATAENYVAGPFTDEADAKLVMVRRAVVRELNRTAVIVAWGLIVLGTVALVARLI